MPSSPPHLAEVFKRFLELKIGINGIIIAILTIFFMTLFFKWPYTSGLSIPYAILTTGFSAMIFDLAIIFTFQTIYGYLYHQIGLLVAMFMVGVAISSYRMNHHLERIREKSRIFLLLEGGIILFSILLPFGFSIPSLYMGKKTVYFLLYGLFFIVSFLGGASIGLQFPLAARIYLTLPVVRGTPVAKTAGVLYGADLLGGFYGGLLGGVILLPILGLKDTCFLIAILKTSSLLLFLISFKINRVK